MKLLIDGIFYRLNDTGIARVWSSIIPRLAARHEIEVHILDRGGMPEIPGTHAIPYPTTSSRGSAVFNYCADDSALIQRVCDHLGIDVFMSTYFTSPLSTPALQVVYDMIPELFGFDLRHPSWMEKEMALAFAQRFVCISESTRRDLLSFYPEIPPSKATVAHCGVDSLVFRPRPEPEVEGLRRSQGLERDYFLFVGSRFQHTGYKNGMLFFEALAGMESADFDVLCVGGESRIEKEVERCLPHGVACRRVELTDAELANAYAGASALVYPSLYEGFGMPVIEAMASGCPVITTRHGALAESAGEAALFIGGTSVDEMADALRRVREPDTRAALRQAGYEHAAGFTWDSMAARIAAEAGLLVEEARNGDYETFFRSWSTLRRVQAGVDFEWVPPR